MSDSLNRFNWIAPHYDAVSRLVYGKAILNSQSWALERIPSDSAVLVLGGGSGAILPLLNRINPTCRIWYVEASSVMLARAAATVDETAKDKIVFIHGTETAIPHLRYDVVITNFLLDLYPDTDVRKICDILGNRLKAGGIWLASDFIGGGKWWHRIMLWLMYRFFVLTCQIKASRLPDWEKQIRSTGLTEVAFRTFYGGFIKSAVYVKQP
jgi:SAM-dependent methyltransferase